MSVGSHLTSLASSLVLSEDENAKITTSISTLNIRIDNYFDSNVKEHIQFGSSTRGTILPRKADDRSDIDYMVVFDTSGGIYKPQTYLDKLKAFVLNKYSTSEIKPSHPTIVLELQHIKFELVPAITDGIGYKIPSPSSSYTEWMYTDPNDLNQKITTANTNNNYQIKPLIRLVKYWNTLIGRRFYSYYLENCIIDTLFWSCTSLKDYFFHFWTYYNCPSEVSQTIKDKVSQAKATVANIKKLESEGKLTEAESELKKFLPSI